MSIKRKASPTTAIYCAEYRKYLTEVVCKETLLCIDPGETVGWAIFQNGELRYFGHLLVKQMVDDGTTLDVVLGDFFCGCRLLADTDVFKCVIEDYAVYAHKLQANVWSSLFTVRLIGAVELFCAQQNLPLSYQMAAEAKFFGSEEKMKRWGIWQIGFRHANDAIRHGLYYMLRKSNKGNNK